MPTCPPSAWASAVRTAARARSPLPSPRGRLSCYLAPFFRGMPLLWVSVTRPRSWAKGCRRSWGPLSGCVRGASADSPVRGTVWPAEGPGRKKSGKDKLALVRVGPPPSPARGCQQSWSSGLQTQMGTSTTGSPGPQILGLACNPSTGSPGPPARTGQITVRLSPVIT